MTVYAKLLAVQKELKAPKSQYNSFGKYHYRSCEDILEAVKPICHKHDSVVFMADEIVAVNDRIYVKAIATFVDIETGESINSTAYAREEETKKGMDASQITGTASSYARKYCLNGLFDIDDTKDADTDTYTATTKRDDNVTAQVVSDKTEKYVGNKDGKTIVKNKNGKWYELEKLSVDQLNGIINDAKYKECHNEARKLMAGKALC